MDPLNNTICNNILLWQVIRFLDNKVLEKYMAWITMQYSCTLVIDLEGTDGRERGQQDESLGIGLNAMAKNIKGELD